MAKALKRELQKRIAQAINCEGGWELFQRENYFRGLRKKKKSLAQGLVCVSCGLRVKCPPHNQNQELFVLLRDASNKRVKSYKHTMLAQGPGTGHLSFTLSTVLLSLGLSRAGYFIHPHSFTYKRKVFKRNKEICSYIFFNYFQISHYLWTWLQITFIEKCNFTES